MSDLILSGPGDEPRAVTLGAVTRIRDVLVWQTNHDAGSSEDYRAHPPIDAPRFGREGDERAGPVDVGRGLIVGRLERGLADRVMDACTPAGENFSPHRQFGQRFSFIREVDTAEWTTNPYAWDGDHANLGRAAALTLGPG